MIREEAINWLKAISFVNDPHITDAIDMAIEALSDDSVSREEYEEVKAYMDTLVDAFIEDGEELAESVNVVRCKDCKHKEHCHETVGHTRLHDDFQEHWSETIEWCSRGERKGGEDE